MDNYTDQTHLTIALAVLMKVGITGETAQIAASEALADRLDSAADHARGMALHADDGRVRQRDQQTAAEYAARARALRAMVETRAA